MTVENKFFPMIDAIIYHVCKQQPAVFFCLKKKDDFKNVDFERLNQRLTRSLQNVAVRFLF